MDPSLCVRTTANTRVPFAANAAEVLRDLFVLKVDKELSYGERNMLDTARKLLMKELTLAVDKEELSQEEDVRQIFGL